MYKDYLHILHIISKCDSFERKFELAYFPRADYTAPCFLPVAPSSSRAHVHRLRLYSHSGRFIQVAGSSFMRAPPKSRLAPLRSYFLLSRLTSRSVSQALFLSIGFGRPSFNDRAPSRGNLWLHHPSALAPCFSLRANFAALLDFFPGLPTIAQQFQSLNYGCSRAVIERMKLFRLAPTSKHLKRSTQ
jgi:hypothetical protein